MYGAVAGRMLRSVKISNRQRQRAAQETIEKGTKIFFTLLTVLAQSGGEVTVTQGTIDQVALNLKNLGVAVDEKGTERVVRLVEGGVKERFYTGEELNAKLNEGAE